MKIFTLGNGFVASHLPYPKILDKLWADQKRIHYVLKKYKSDVIVNCIGRCGTPTIDWCESHKEETVIANTIIPTLLAAECEKLGIRFIHIGSGCVYSGTSPNVYRHQTDQGKFSIDKQEREGDWITVDHGFRETDPANPQSYYSACKAATDLVISSMQCSTILRIRMPISDQDTPRNLINKLRNYKRIIEIPNSVTFMGDLVNCIDWAINKDIRGIYHVTNFEPLTAARIMQEYQKYISSHQFEIINEQRLDKITLAKRSNCILNSDKLKLAGFQMTNSDEALANCMKNYIKNIGINGK